MYFLRGFSVIFLYELEFYLQSRQAESIARGQNTQYSP